MSVQAMSDVWEHSPRSGAAMLVELAIADVVNDVYEQRFWMIDADLARKARVSVSTVRRVRSTMIDEGALILLTAGGGRGKACELRYVFHDDRKRVHGESVSGSPIALTDDTERVHSEPDTRSSGEPSPLSNPREPNTTQAPTIDEALVEPERLANLLADLVAADGSKRPTVTKTWIADVEKLHRLDGRSYEQIESAIKWAQSHHFWHRNILSPAKLRSQYDRLRKEALASRSGRVRDLSVLDVLDRRRDDRIAEGRRGGGVIDV